MTMTAGAMSVTAYAEEIEQSIYIYSGDIETTPQTAEDQVTVDNVDNPAYIAYVKTLEVIPHEKELIELIDSNIKHIYHEPHMLVEFEEEDGTRVFKDCNSIGFSLFTDKSGIINGHTIEEVNEYLKEIGSKQYFRYVTHPNGDSIYDIYCPGEEWCAANGIDMDNDDFKLEVYIKLCQKFGFEVGWKESIYGSDHFPKFKQGEDYGTYITLDPARYGTEEGKVEVKLYEDGRTEYPSGAIKYADETIKYPEGYEPPEEHREILIDTLYARTIEGLKGDANLDSIVDIADLTTVAKYDLNNKLYPLVNDAAFSNADMNGDGEVNGLDTSALIENQLGE